MIGPLIIAKGTTMIVDSEMTVRNRARRIARSINRANRRNGSADIFVTWYRYYHTAAYIESMIDRPRIDSVDAIPAEER